MLIYSSSILVEMLQNKLDEAETLLPKLCNYDPRPAGTTINQGYLGKAISGMTAMTLTGVQIGPES